MKPLQITITPTSLVFENLDENEYIHLIDELKLKLTYKGKYFMEGEHSELYKTLLNLSYKYDIEIF